jgi:hypothetical protein
MLTSVAVVSTTISTDHLSILSNSVVSGNGRGGDIFLRGGALTISSDSHVILTGLNVGQI